MDEKTYEKLAKDLPPYEEVNKAFDLASIEEEDLRAVAKKMASRFEQAAELIEGVLHPEQRIASMHESAAFSDAEKEQLLDLLRRLMRSAREYVRCELLGEGFEEYITRAWSCWSESCDALVTFSERLARSWDAREELSVRGEYFG